MRGKFLIVIVLAFPLGLVAQNDAISNHENLVYYNSSVKDYLSYMRDLTNDQEKLALIDSMIKYNLLMEENLNNTVLPEYDATEEQMEEMPSDSTWDYGMENPEYESEDMEEDYKSFGMNKFIPFKNKIKTKFEIQFGVNNIHINAISQNAIEPEVHTPASWFWEFGLLTNNRIGKKNSKVALSYGFSYLINRFSMDNDVRLDVINNQPQFVEVAGAKRNPKLNIGYITVPLALDFKFSKGFQCSIGGFAGYRVHTVQKLETKPGYERIEEERFANYRLNNWTYGAKFSVGLRGFNLVGRYCFSNLFRETTPYDMNVFMIGTSLRI